MKSVHSARSQRWFIPIIIILVVLFGSIYDIGSVRAQSGETPDTLTVDVSADPTLVVIDGEGDDGSMTCSGDYASLAERADDAGPRQLVCVGA